MSTNTADTDTLDLLGFDDADRRDVERLLTDPAVAEAARLAEKAILPFLGTFEEARLDHLGIPPLAWLRAYVELTPRLIAHHEGLGVPAEVTGSTLADVGRNTGIHRLRHGGFGLETWTWLIPHYVGMLFGIGRLTFALQRTQLAVPAGSVSALPGGIAPGDWVVGMHIPESGPLSPDQVDESIRRAREFFGTVFPDRRIVAGVCESWLLDPFLARSLPADTNLVRFAERYTLVGEPVDAATEALYFLFRERDRTRLPHLEHPTALQRLVIERYDRGEAWQVATGVLAWGDG
ncbi:DUF5596 domain-containing protein [Leifsonia shinshuensis]|uniref:acyltransferase domain-containing protein n=1 Tax=Leifsonia shinshuensis TaxID=150026 RepID=UPI001F507A4A|nr:acyltransferase domain-containing protein [Leifsonia shinshuensis]MCI0158458.1 DUF5596 domain-containing protein [Leifsonia shinshuensis]